MMNYARQCEDIAGLYNGARPPISSRLLSCSKKFLDHVFGIDKLNNIYERIADSSHGRDFLRTLIKELNITYELDRGDLSNIPKTGPVIVVANHPFGAVEDIVLTAPLAEVRRDVKILANHLLHCFPELRDTLILVDLTLTPANLLERYMGKPGAETFLNHQKIHLASSPAGNLS
jgi:putative hemolysin